MNVDTRLQTDSTFLWPAPKIDLPLGKLEIKLEWYNKSDLDLQVFCACGSDICFKSKECTKCKGWLDRDCNARSFDAIENPSETIEFPNAINGYYQIRVNDYKSYTTEPTPFKVTVTLHKLGLNYVFDGMVSKKGSLVIYEGLILELFPELQRSEKDTTGMGLVFSQDTDIRPLGGISYDTQYSSTGQTARFHMCGMMSDDLFSAPQQQQQYYGHSSYDLELDSTRV